MTTLTDCSLTAVPSQIDCDICIVGSGFGGATAARILAVAGRDVVVLEEGGDFTGKSLTQRDAAMYDQLYVQRGGATTQDMGISLLAGRVLGGGGVINACDVVPAEDAIWRMWQKRFGLEEFSPEAMAPFARQALADLGARPIREEQINRNNAILRQGAAALGWRGEVMQHNRADHCKGLGTCLVGCPLDAKQNARITLIPKAIGAGARVLCRARAVRIEAGNSEQKRVQCRSLDRRGYHEQQAFEVRAKIVILAANPLGTVPLLLRSGLGNGHVGRSLSLQPQVPILALFEQPVDAFHGIPQSYAVTQFATCDEARGHGGFRIEGIMGTPGIVGSLVPQAGVAGKELMTQLRNIAASLLLLPDESVGRIALGGAGQAVVRYDLTAEWRQRARQAIRTAARAYFAAGAKTVVLPTVPPKMWTCEADLRQVDALSLAPATLPLLSAHQQGGVRMAASEKDGAADPTGRVFGTRDVYVMDSSGFPTTASSHTMAPILAVAHRQAARLAGRSKN